MAFDPQKHVISLKGKAYLETRWRIAWFRDEHPDGAIVTEILSQEPIMVKATVLNGAGQILATGHGGALDKGNAVWSGRGLEKAESAAIGRALGHAGYGTQFLESDADHLADSPIEAKRQSVQQAAQAAGGTASKRPAPTDAQDDLTNRDTAADFMKATRAAGISDEDVLKALGVSKLSEWKDGRKAAGQRVKEWQAFQSVPA